MGKQGEPSRTVKTSETVFGIIEALQALDGATLTELADHLDMANSTIYDHLATLEMKGYVVEQANEYHLSLQFLQHGIYARSRRKIWQPAEQVIERLSKETGEGVRIWVEEHGKTVLLGCAFGEQAVELPPFDSPGTTGFMHCHAGGKAILAHLPEDRIEKIVDRYGLPQQTPNTITDPDRLRDELDAIRQRGFVFEDSEVIPDIRSVAAPIVVNDRVLGSLSIAAPASRMQDDYFEKELPNHLLAAAEETRLRLVENFELEGEVL